MTNGSIPHWLEEANQLDFAVYVTIAETATPALDGALSHLSRAADYSRLSLGTAAVLALAGGPMGRRAALRGLASVAVTATIVNLLFKPITRRRRPDRTGASVSEARHVPMPSSRSFPSGHSAVAFAFAAGAGGTLSWTGPPLTALATLVAYSRVHTGVHYPADVIAGSLCGVTLAAATGRAVDRLGSHRFSSPRSSQGPVSCELLRRARQAWGARSIRSGGGAQPWVQGT